MRHARRSSLALVILTASLACAADSLAQRPTTTDAARREMRAAEQARASSQAARRDAARRAEQATAAERKLAQERVSTAARLRDAEEATARVATRLEQLARDQAKAEAHLQARAADLAPLLPVIQRLSLHPGETMLAVRPDQEAALRGAIVLRALAGRLEVEAGDLRVELALLATARAAVAAEQPRLAAARAAQAAQGQALDRQIEAAQANRQAALDAGEEAARHVAEQAARAENLRAVIAEIEANRRTAEARAREEAARATRARRTEAAADARRRQVALSSPTGAGTIAASAQPAGQLVTPVTGNLTRNWGDSTDAGPANGLTWRPAPGARVLAPCSGRVMFAAPFRSFGPLMIVDCGGGHHVVLSGLERLDTSPGRTLHAGEPVGTMANWDPASSGPRPALYLELRRDGRPVNPMPWLRGRG